MSPLNPSHPPSHPSSSPKPINFLAPTTQILPALDGPDTLQSEGVMDPMGTSPDPEPGSVPTREGRPITTSQKPSPWWILFIMGLSSTVLSMTFAPKTEVYFRLVCEQYSLEPTPPIFPTPPENHPVLLLSPNSPNIPSYLPRALESTVHVASLLTKLDNVLVRVPRPSSKCTSDPEVGRIVAGIHTAVNLTLGILSLVTTGYWGSYSDRAGRKRVLGISFLAALLTDVAFVIITLLANKIPNGYNLFIFCSVIHGFAGGLVVNVAAAQSYCSDCADSSSRARLFSIFYGMSFAGMAVGPTIGGLLITVTNDMLSVFYIATIGHLISASLVWFIIPESLPSEIRAVNSSTDKPANNGDRMAPIGFSVLARQALSSLFSFLAPLKIFLPCVRDGRESGNSGRGGRDWNLTFIGLSSGVSYAIAGTVALKFQYAEAAFGWNSETLGYYLTGIGVTRAFHLTILLPLIIRIFGPKKGKLHNPGSPRDQYDTRQPLLDESQLTSAQVRPGQVQRYTYAAPTTIHSARRHGDRSAHMNLTVAGVSLLVESTAFILISLSTTGPQFFASYMMVSLGAGFNPSIQALALHLMPNGSKDAGKLFGAIGMLGALSSQVVGPTLFGIIYMATVATFPRTIFIVAAAIHFCAFILLAFVRLSPDEY